jgi:hypothetical protein
LQHAASPEEVRDATPDPSPSSGHLPLCGCGRYVYYEWGDDDDLMWFHSDDHTAIGLECTRAQPVSQEDLAAHITAVRSAWLRRWTEAVGPMPTLSEEIAADLLIDYTITKK